MNLSQYEAFVKAAEAGTITEAAEELGYTQSGSYPGAECFGKTVAGAASHAGKKRRAPNYGG